MLLGANTFFASEDIDVLINKAEVLRQKAGKAGFEWTTTAPLIRKAKAAVEKGDKKLAITLAEKAIRQGENALIQARHAEKHWRDSVPE